MRRLLRRLQGPVALAVQGFILGGLFIVVVPGSSAPAESNSNSVLSTIEPLV